jgi:hypothetical protein
MLVRFGLDPAVLEPAGARPDARWIREQEELLRLWRRHGVLVQDGALRSECEGRIRALPDRLRLAWAEAWARLRRQIVDEALALPGGSMDQGSYSDQPWEVACLSDARADIAGLAVDEETRSLGERELARYHCLDRARAFAAALRRADEPLRKGAKPAGIWHERCAPFAATSRHCAVVDRYAAGNLLRQQGPALARVLAWLARDGGGLAVKLYSGCSADPGRIRSALVAALPAEPSPGLRHLELFLVPDATFARIKHDRYLRFGSALLSFGRGIDVFLGRALRDAEVDAHLRHLDRDALRRQKEIERQLAAAAALSCVLLPAS